MNFKRGSILVKKRPSAAVVVDTVVPSREALLFTAAMHYEFGQLHRISINTKFFTRQVNESEIELFTRVLKYVDSRPRDVLSDNLKKRKKW